MKKFRSIWVAAAMLLAVLAGGCQRRPLETAYRSTIRVIVKCIWKATLYPDGIKPSGVTLYFFKDGQYYTSFPTVNVDSCEVQLPKGSYQLYMISHTEDEYWKMTFENMSDFNAADVTLNTKSTPNWIATRALTDPVVENPQILYAGVSEQFVITEEMAEEYQMNYVKLKSLKSKAAENAATKASLDEQIEQYEELVQYYTIRIPIEPQNVVSQLWVSIYAGNADVLKDLKASTSGMAKTFELTQFTTNNESAIQIISKDDWSSVTMDYPEKRVGHIDGIITTFGLPNGESPTALRDSTLNVSALLIDNATIADYVFDVGDKIQELPPNQGYRNLYRLIIGNKDDPAVTFPDVKPEGSKASGIDATVDDWEEGETVEIPM